MNVEREIAALRDMSVGELHDRYVEVFGEPVRSRHKDYLIRRIAWRLQANAEGGLSQRALARAEELAANADVRVTPPRVDRLTGPRRPDRVAPVGALDPRLPPVGSQVVREYKCRCITATVLADGFEYRGERYRSLSAVAKAVTGTHWNGFLLFELNRK